MAFQTLVFLFALAALADGPPRYQVAPQAPPDALYCLRVEPTTGSRMETVRCETRATWAAMEIDVDVEWTQEGVRIIT